MDAEDGTLASLQLDSGLVKENSEHAIEARTITDNFFRFYAALSQF